MKKLWLVVFICTSFQLALAEPDSFLAPDAKSSELLKKMKPQPLEAKIFNRVQFYNVFKGEGWSVKYTKVDSLPGGKLAEIIPEIAEKNDAMVIHLKMTEEGINNPAVVLEEFMHLDQITNVKLEWRADWKNDPKFNSYTHPHQWAELSLNSESGSLVSREYLAKMQIERTLAAKDAFNYYNLRGLFDPSDIVMAEEYFSARIAHAEENFKQISKQASAYLKQKKVALDQNKKVFEIFEKHPAKFNDLIAKNDRKGVRMMIEAYLPWDVMEPAEKKAWKTWLEVMENPDKDKLKLVFRGMDDDVVQMTAEGKPYIMSTVLSRNQGNYTRRLRSLATMREKFGQTIMRKDDAVKPLYVLPKSKNPTSLTLTFYNHGDDPLGSPYISTSNYSVAKTFGQNKMGALLIDERRLITNPASPFVNEKEILAPLIVFPDEFVHFEDHKKTLLPIVPEEKKLALEERSKKFLGEVEKKLARPIAEVELKGISDEAFLSKGFHDFRDLVLTQKPSDSVLTGIACGPENKCDCIMKVLNGILK